MLRAVCRSQLAACAVALALFSGCAGFSPLVDERRLAEGYTLVLPGIDGQSPAIAQIADNLAAAGVPTAIEVYDWTHGSPWLMGTNLYSRQRNQQQARTIASKIIDYQDRYPGRPVHLVAHSGGCGLALWALEQLPAERRVTSAVLLSAAVSTKYNVAPALAHTERGIWNFYAPTDLMLLAGTVVARTIDSQHSVGAGAVGFRNPLNEASAATPRLVQVPFTPQMIRSGHFGGHWGPAGSTFARDYVAPILDSPRTAMTPSAPASQAETMAVKPEIPRHSGSARAVARTAAVFLP